MSAKILVVDDDINFRKSVVRVLRNNKLNISEASNGKEALQLLKIEKFNLVISDIRMPVMHGIEFYHAMKKLYTTPFIFMTGFSDLLDISEAYDLGAEGFLSKPFERDELLNLVTELVKEEEIKFEVKSKVESSYYGLPIEEFINGRTINYPIYLKLSEEKFIKVANFGEDLTLERIASYKSKGIHYLYLENSEFRKYLNYSTSVMGSAVSSEKLNLQEKQELLLSTNKIIYDYGFKNSIDDELFNFSCKVITDTLKVISDESDFLRFFKAINNSENDLFYHSIGVAMVANLIALKRGWSSFTMHFQVTTAALFHDIGLRDVPEEIIKIPYDEMTLQQKQLYENHTTIGAELIRKIGSTPQHIDTIILHHHERCNGSGYPAKLDKHKIHPIAQMIGIADEFCTKLHGPPFSNLGNKDFKLSAKEISYQSELFLVENLKALQEIFLQD